MTAINGSDTFYGGIAVFRGFGRLMDPALYSPLPDDWTIGVADIVESTRAIAEARYKAVNMAGAAVIAAVTNALDGREFPFVFGGDGASFAVSPDDRMRKIARHFSARPASRFRRRRARQRNLLLSARPDRPAKRCSHRCCRHRRCRSVRTIGSDLRGACP
jgi:hypothetical protein